MIYGIHLLKFYYFCNLIHFSLFIAAQDSVTLLAFLVPLDKDVSSFIMSMIASRLKQPAHYNCFHWCQPSLSPPLLLQPFHEDTDWQ